MNTEQNQFCVNRAAAKRNVVSSVNGRRLCGCCASAMQRPRRSMVWNFSVAAALALFSTTGIGHATGTVVGQGWNDYGQTTIPSGLSNVVAIAAGWGHSLALTGEGRVIGWGYNYYGQTNTPSGLSNVVAIAAGWGHSLALTTEGQVAAWGYNSAGQTNIPSALSNVVAIAAGGSHNLALIADGGVIGWGYNEHGITNIPSGLSNVVAIAAGGVGSFALTADGRVVGWGYNGYGQTNIPSGLSNVVAIAVGDGHTLSLTAEGQVVGWGYNNYGQTNIPSGLSNVVAIAAGNYHSLALTAEGRVVGWGNNGYGQAPSIGWSDVVAIAAGGYHNLALSSDAPPTITGQPASESVIAGATVALQAKAFWMQGMPMLQYQWQKGGTNLLGQTDATLRWDGVTASDAGNYAVIVSNFAGQSATSSVATLTVSCLLTVNSTPGGSATPTPDLPIYAGNSMVSLTATPMTGYGFIRWTGDATDNANPLTVVMDTNKHITAVFASTVLTLGAQGVGSTAKVPDEPFYTLGDEVTLNATAGRWHIFSGWTDGNINNPRVVTIGESNAYTAVFTPTTPLDTVTIGDVSRLAPVGMPAVAVDGALILAESVSARGSAQVTLSTTFPGGWLFYTLDGSDPVVSAVLYAGPFRVRQTSVLRTIAYNADFTEAVLGDPLTLVILPTLTGWTAGGGSVGIEPPTGDYFSNSLAVVTAAPAAGWNFLQWLGDAEGTNPVVEFSMTRNKTAQAMFGTTLNTTIVGGGNLVVEPVSPWYPYGTEVRLTAVPATGNHLAFWANAGGGRTNNPLLFTVTNASPTVTAVFASLGTTQTNTLTVIPNGRGEVTLTPPGHLFQPNTNVVLEATPEAGQEFLGWAGDASGSANPLTVTMSSNKVITATFTRRPWLRGEGSPEMLAQEGFRLTLDGEFNAAYEIFGSADLNGWASLGIVTNFWGTVQFTDAEAATNAYRFYRGRVTEQ